MRRLTVEQLNSLESLIDYTSVRALLEAIADICTAKAEHVTGHWQDTPLAYAWEEAAIAVRNTADMRRVRKVSEG